MLPPCRSSLHLKRINELLNTKTPGAIDDQCRSSVLSSPIEGFFVCCKQLMYCSPLQRCFTFKPPVVSAALGRMCGVLAPPFGRCCSPYHSVRCVKRPEESVGLEGLAKASCGLLAVGRSAITDPVKRQCWGVGSVTRLCTEKGGGGVKGVYTEGIPAHYCRLFRASTSLSRKRTRPTDCVIVINLFMDACTSGHHPSAHAWSDEQPTIPFRHPDQCPSLLRS